MKLSVVISDSNAGPSAFVVWRGFSVSMRKAAEYGYNGVELALRSRNDIDPNNLRSLLDNYRLEVSCISTGQVFADSKLYLTNQNKEKRNEAIKVINELVEFSSEFGAKINLGRVRGFINENQTESLATEIFLDSLDQILHTAEKNGVTILIEPVNRYEINFINNVQQCANLLKSVSSSNIGIMPDTFHMNIEEVNISEVLRNNSKKIKYIHLSDSNRLAPGWGHLNFEEVFMALSDMQYEGWLSAEILPFPTPDEAAKQAADFLLPMIHKYTK